MVLLEGLARAELECALVILMQEVQLEELLSYHPDPGL